MAKIVAKYTWLARQAHVVDGEAVLADPIEITVMAGSRKESLQLAKQLLEDDKEMYLCKIEDHSG